MRLPIRLFLSPGPWPTFVGVTRGIDVCIAMGNFNSISSKAYSDQEIKNFTTRGFTPNLTRFCRRCYVTYANCIRARSRRWKAHLWSLKVKKDFPSVHGVIKIKTQSWPFREIDSFYLLSLRLRF